MLCDDRYLSNKDSRERLKALVRQAVIEVAEHDSDLCSSQCKSPHSSHDEGLNCKHDKAAGVDVAGGDNEDDTKDVNSDIIDDNYNKDSSLELYVL